MRDSRRRGIALPSPALVIKAGLVGALGYWVASYLDFAGLEYVSAQFERLILFTYPLFVVIFGALFFGPAHAAESGGGHRPQLRPAWPSSSWRRLSNRAPASPRVPRWCSPPPSPSPYTSCSPRASSDRSPAPLHLHRHDRRRHRRVAQFLATRPLGEIAAVSPRVWEISVFLAIGATVLPSFFLNAALHRISAQANATIGTLSRVRPSLWPCSSSASG
ncbi:MAG: hypothetical protein WDM84_06180 [Bauldia sp.]